MSDKLQLVLLSSRVDIPIYGRAWQNVQVAGMETRDYLSFVVSNPTLEDSLQIATRLWPSVWDFLNKIEA